MSKKRKHSKNSRNNVNFSNPKVQTILTYIQLGENRISKNEIFEIGTKDIFYQLRQNNLIKEQGKGNYVGTSKLHNYISKRDGTHFASSGSSRHSAKVRESLSFIPKSVLQRRSYKSSYDVERDFAKTTLGTRQYERDLEELKQNYRNRLDDLERGHIERLKASYSSSKRYLEDLDYIKAKSAYLSRIDLLEEKAYLVPDYQITLTRDELETYISNLESYLEELQTDIPRYDLYSDSISKLRGLDRDQEEYTINIEITTNSYKEREMELHRNFEVLSHTTQIFL